MHIVRGNSVAVRACIERLVASEKRPITFASGPIPWSWSCALSLFESLGRHLDKTEIERIERGHHHALNLLRVDPNIQDAVPVERPALGGYLTSHLSHNWFSKRPFVDALVDLFAPLLARSGATVVVPDLATVDEESQMLLRALCRKGFDRMIVGVGTDSRQDAPDDQGLLWRFGRRDVFRIAADLLCTPGVVLHEPLSGEASAAIPVISFIAPEDVCLARIEGDLPDEVDLAAVVNLMRARFRAFGNISVLRLGLAVLDHHERLSIGDGAEARALVALCAHNRQFRSEGNLSIGEFILSHTQTALQLETRSAVRCALLYRLAVTLGRRLGRTEEAEVAASAGIEEANCAGMAAFETAYQRAWCHNIRAYARARGKDKTGAEQDARDATEILRPFADTSAALGEATLGGVPRGWRADIQSSTAVFASGVALFKSLQNELEDAAAWRTAAQQLEPEHPGFARLVPMPWIDVYCAQFRPDLALVHAEEGLVGSRAERDALREYQFLFLGADLAFRLGEVERSMVFFQELQSLHRRYGQSRFLSSPELPSAAAYARAGHHGVAQAILSTALLDRTISAHGQAEIHLWLARISATRQESEIAQAQADLAIDVALSSGSLNTLTLVASTVGDIANRLDRPDDARESYARALELIEDTPRGKRGRLEVDWLRALVGQAETKRARPDSLLDAIRVVPGALRQTEGWWLLPRLLRWTASTCTRQIEDVREQAERAFSILATATMLRDDCKSHWHQVFGSRSPMAPAATPSSSGSG